MFLIDLMNKKIVMFDLVCVLFGCFELILILEMYFVNGCLLVGFYLDGMKCILLGMGCFWGVECYFWKIFGVWVMVVGYVGGFMFNLIY